MVSAHHVRSNKTGWMFACFFITWLLPAMAYAQSPCFQVNGSNATVIRGCVPFTVIVNDDCANYAPPPNPPIKYNYGDGPGGPNAAVFDTIHTYTRPGRYAITQYGTFNATGDSLRKDNYIEVLPVPEPPFTLSTCSGREVSLTITDNVYNSYVIDWGDGTPAETKPAAGTYRHTYVNVNPRTVTVSGQYAGINCGGSASLAVNPIASLPKPELISLTTLSATAAQIRFRAEAGVVYHIEKRNETTGIYTEVLSLTNNSAGPVGQQLNDPQPATYRVSTVDACGNTVPSDEISSVLVNAVAADGQNQVSWKTNPVATFVKSTLNRNDQLLQEYATIATNAYVDADVACGNTYCYQVQISLSGSAAKSISNSACVKAISTAKPPPIQNVTATVVDNKVVLTWDAPAGNSAVREYVISRASDSSAYASIARITGNRYEDENSLLDKSRQCYKVSYYDNCGNLSETSVEACPVSLQVEQVTSPGNEGYQLSWTPYVQWPDGVQTYEVEKLRGDNSVIENQGSNGTELFFPYDTANQLIRFRVRAIGAGKVSESNIVEIRQDVRIFAPEAFTPNGDGINDRFDVKGLFVSKYEITIYNRWGEAVFGSNRMDIGWDGRNNRYTALTGAYSYSIRVEDQIGRIVVKRGSLLIIKQ